MDESKDRPWRFSNYYLKKYADELEQNIKIKSKYTHITDMKEELLLELVRRELERSGHDEGQEANPGVL